MPGNQLGYYSEEVGMQIMPGPETPGDSGFSAMGKPVPLYRQQAAYEHCKQMGMTDTEKMSSCVSGMSEALARDKPYDAMTIGMLYLDLTGAYRLMAVLLCEPKPRYKVKAGSNRL